MQCIVMLNILSFGFFIFPSIFTEESTFEIIFPAAIGGILMFFISKLVIYVCSGRTRSLYDIFEKNSCKETGNAFKWVFVFYFILKSASIFMMYNNAIKRNILFQTPSPVIIGIGLLTALFLSVKGIETIGRISEILIILVLAGILFIFIFAIISGGLSDIYIEKNIDISEIFLSSAKSLYFFQGFEVVFFLYTFLGTREDLNFKGIPKAFILVAVIMIFSAFLISAKLGIIKDSSNLWPFIRIADNIEIPFAFIERQDFIIVNLITVFMILGTAINIFCVSKILAEITKKFSETEKFSIWAAAGIAAVLVLKNIKGLFSIINQAEFFLGIISFIIIPIVLAILKKRRRENEN